MADIRPLTETFAVAPQVRAEEMAELAARFSLIVNNRPDGEAPGQPGHAELEAAARAAGLGYVFIPISGVPRPEQVAAMRAVIQGADGPALAFCRSGTRSALTWAIGELLAGRAAQELIAAGAGAGYDLGPSLNAIDPQHRVRGGSDRP